MSTKQVYLGATLSQSRLQGFIEAYDVMDYELQVRGNQIWIEWDDDADLYDELEQNEEFDETGV